MSDKNILSFNQPSPPRREEAEPSGDRPVKQRLAAILAADVAEYTRLVEKDTEATVIAWQAARDDIIEPAVARQEGRIIKLTGDGFLAEFATVQAAVNCAIEQQDGLRPGPLDFRMGVSMGDIVDDGRDVHGEGVNIAARLEALSDPGGICVSGDVYNQVRNRIDEAFDDWGEQQVKHVSRPIRVYALRRFVAAGNQRPPPSKSPSQASPKTVSRWAIVVALLVVFAGGVWAFGPWTKQPEPPVPMAATGETRAVVDGSVSQSVVQVPSGTAGLQPGTVASGENTSEQIFRDCDVCPEMAVVPPGKFRMGWNKGDADEAPEHDVVIAKAFAVGRYEITFNQWEACVSNGGCGAYRPNDSGWGRGDRPVINVSWKDVQTYLVWLSGRTGKKYRLLSEAEWEYAARGGSSELYPWGVTIDAGKANYGLFRNKTVPGGAYEENAFGLYDVIGNVWEWVADCYVKKSYRTYAGYPVPVSGDDAKCHRVLRGGSWNVDMSDGYELLRVSIREKGRNTGRYNNRGFRVARDTD